MYNIKETILIYIVLFAMLGAVVYQAAHYLQVMFLPVLGAVASILHWPM